MSGLPKGIDPTWSYARVGLCLAWGKVTDATLEKLVRSCNVIRFRENLTVSIDRANQFLANEGLDLIQPLDDLDLDLISQGFRRRNWLLSAVYLANTEEDIEAC